MKILFLVNCVEDLRDTQTTTLLIDEALEMGHEVFISAVDGLSLKSKGHIYAKAHRAHIKRSADKTRHKAENPIYIALYSFDVLLIRTNPHRDKRAWAHETALDMVRVAEERGLLVLNKPEGLIRSASKMYLRNLPSEFRPHTVVSNNIKTLRNFVQKHERSVVKPLRGTRGKGVFFFKRNRLENFNAVLEILLNDGYVMAQEYVPGASAGDVRLLVVDGKLLEIGGSGAAFCRVPAPGEFRSNVHQGGRSGPVSITPVMRRVVEAVGPLLRADGLFLVGLDLIGNKVIEINVFSPGGMRNGKKFYGHNFAAAFIDLVETKVSEQETFNSTG